MKKSNEIKDKLSKIGFIFEEKKEDFLTYYTFSLPKKLGDVLKLNKKYLIKNKYYSITTEIKEEEEKYLEKLSKKIFINENKSILKIEKLYKELIEDFSSSKTKIIKKELEILFNIDLPNLNGKKTMIENFEFFNFDEETFIHLSNNFDKEDNKKIPKSYFFENLDISKKEIILEKYLHLKDKSVIESKLNEKYLI